jgi:alpha-tubulin suppressor-like RCC1 family protein
MFSNITQLISSSIGSSNPLSGGNFNCIQQNAKTPIFSISCWGDNSSGQLGQNNTSLNASTPVPIPIPQTSKLPAISPPSTSTTLTANMALGQSYACLSTSDGLIYCWGNNQSGQLGIGNNTPTLLQSTGNKVDFSKAISQSTYFPSTINPHTTNLTDYSNPISTFAQTALIAAGSEHTCALFPNGTMLYSQTPLQTINGALFCWGKNDFYQLGINNGNNISGVNWSSSGTTPQYDYSSAPTIKSSFPIQPANFHCWPNSTCTYGDYVTNNATIQQITSGSNHTCVSFKLQKLQNNSLITYYKVGCWGDNSCGKLALNRGIGDSMAALHNMRVNNIESSSPITQIAAGNNHTCALFSFTTKLGSSIQSSQVWCWGDNSVGQLGNTKTQTEISTGMFTPQPISLPTTNITQIATGSNHTCATDNTTIWCWGDNSAGQLGTGTPSSDSTLQTINFPSNGTNFNTMCFSNAPQQQTNCTAPFYISPPPPSTARTIFISAGSQHSCAAFTTTNSNPDIGNRSSIYCWGSNSQNQLGNLKAQPSTYTAGTPVNVLNQ